MVDIASTQEIEDLWAAVTSGRVSYTGFADLEVAIARPLGSMAEVDGDSGTHEDPVSALIVPNDGVYRRVVEGWQRVADLNQDLAEQAAPLLAQFKAMFLGAFADDVGATNAATLGLTNGMLYINIAATPIIRIYSAGGGWANYDVSAQAAATLAATYGNMTPAPDYATLSGVAAVTGNPPRVVYYDPGTHTDPVTGNVGTSNSGIFAPSTSPAGWKWLGPTVSGNLASQITSLLAAQALPPGVPVQIGQTAGAVNPGATTNSWGNSEPVKASGLLTKFQFNMSAIGSVNILFYDGLTMKVLQIFAGVTTTAGVNTLAAGTINNWVCPVGALAVVVIASGTGQLLTATGATRPAPRWTTASLTGLAVGSTMPAPSTSVAATAADILIETTPTNAQGVDTRLAVIENNKPMEDLAFIGREAYSTQRGIGVTVYDATANVNSASTGRMWLTPPLVHGGKAVSAFINMNAAGSGFLTFLRKINDVPTYSLFAAVPVGPLAAGGNTITLPALDLPPGTVMGYDPVIGGLLNSRGNSTGGKSNYITGFTGVMGSTYTVTQGALAVEMGLTVIGASDRWHVSAIEGDRRRVENTYRDKPRLPKAFVIGVWDQPASLAATWKARGINTFYGSYSDAADGNGPTWISTVVAQGLQYIRRPGLYSLEQANPAGQIISAAQAAQVKADCEYDSVQPLCIGWSGRDEPDGVVTWEEGTGISPTNASRFYWERETDRWRVVYNAKSVFAGFQGFHITNPSTSIRDFMSLRGADVFAFDIYPNFRNTLGAGSLWNTVYTTDATIPDYFTSVNGACCEYLNQQITNTYATFGPTRSGGLPTFCAIATSRVASPGVAPLPGEFRVLCWSAIVGGVIGVQYFPQDVTTGAFISDASDANVLTEMATFHANLTVMQNAGCLIDAVNGGRIPFTKRLSAPITKTLSVTVAGTWPKDTGGLDGVFQTARGIALQGGFEGLRIVGNNGVVYYLLVNLVGVPMTLTDALWGISALAFTAYEVKFVTAAAPTVNLFTSSGL